MNSITIHGMDKTMATMIREKSREYGLSLNRTIKILLERALGIEPQENTLHANDFEEFRGVWSKTEQKEFRQATSDFEKTNREDWE